MITQKYSKKRKILLGMAIVLEIISVIQLIYVITNKINPFNFVLVVALLAGTIAYLSIPECMKVVRGKLSYKELKELLSQEKFKGTTFSLIHKAYLPSDICYSKHWVYLGMVYMPRKMIYRLSGQESSHYTIVYVQTINGKEIRIGDVETTEVKRFLKALKRQIPELSAKSTELYENFGNVHVDANYKSLTKTEWKQMYADQ